MPMNFIVIGIIGLIASTYGDSNSTESPRELDQSFSESVKASVDNLCRESKIEAAASNYSDFIFTYKNGHGIGYTYGQGGMTAAASVCSYIYLKTLLSNICLGSKFSSSNWS
jgi:hypothetical protein